MTSLIRPQDGDTICAQITAQGKAGVAGLRVSGRQALEISKKLCSFLPEKPRHRQAYFGELKFREDPIDEVIALYFKPGRSFTSEEVVEIFCHGSPIICEEILSALQELGCRPAERGEFTYRAFLSGQIDLVQAESVLHLIEAESLKAKRQALRHLQGGLSQTVERIKDEIKNLLTHIEAEIDFSEENLSIMPAPKMRKLLIEIQKSVQNLIQSYKPGFFVREGLKVGIFGPPNTGKSTLLNQLLGEEKAIVSAKAGTTRDQVEGELFLEGQKIKIVDTAGVRESKNFIEQKGIEKSTKHLKDSDICLFVFSALKKDQKAFEDFFLKDKKSFTAEFKHFHNAFLKRRKNNKHGIVIVINKIDIESKEEFLSRIKKTSWGLKNFSRERVFFTSARSGQGVLGLRKFFLKQTDSPPEALNSPRHYMNLKQAEKRLLAAQKELTARQGLAPRFELAAFELKTALKAVQNILGQEADTDVLEKIFRQFCIGK